jgi:SAM-dependent methyltransferase
MDYNWQNDCPDETILNQEDVLRMLDCLLRDEGKWWDGFYGDKTKPIPFFVNLPDESLVSWFENNQLHAGRVLELGCGPGRNAIYMAKQGCTVDAVDVSPVSIDWARERATEAEVDVNFICASIFDLPIKADAYDLVYDCGCFHHIPPHRRMSFLSLITTALKPSGAFGLTCFGAEPPELSGADVTDWQVYRDRKMYGGLGYSKQRLMTIFNPILDVMELRQMKKCESNDGVFGESFLWVGLFRKR